MGKIPRIFEDERPIKSILWSGPEEAHYRVGVGGVEKIEAYQESGDMAYVTWFAVWINGEIANRVNAAYIDTVSYLGE